jgi:hypothetical protein
MSVGLLEGEDLRALVRKRVNSRQWWVILAYNASAYSLLERIEERFYQGHKAAGFEILFPVGPPWFTMGAIAFARKKDMSARNLLSIYRDAQQPGLTLEDLQGRDILLPIEEEAPIEERHAVSLAARWFNAKFGYEEDRSESVRFTFPRETIISKSRLERTRQDRGLTTVQEAHRQIERDLQIHVKVVEDEEAARMAEEAGGIIVIGRTDLASPYCLRCMGCEKTVYFHCPPEAGAVGLCDECYWRLEGIGSGGPT